MMHLPLHLFDAYGIELEYMIVDKNDLSIKPITDKVIFSKSGEFLSDVEFDETAWSNELVLHVIELKTNGPRESLTNLERIFHNDVKEINSILKEHNCVLLPTGMHPFMDPVKETVLWPHEYNITYEAYNKIFDCRNHGWSNLQSIHLNLPFADDEEFEKLHAAVRLLLPIIPAVSASTPIMEGKVSGFLDTRLEVYRNNQNKIPSIAGEIIPEAVFNKTDYENKILKKIYADLSPYDKGGILKNEWVNSRGAIARFERNTIEVRVISIQESPSADLAIINAVAFVLKMLINEKWIKLEEQKCWSEERLSRIFLNIIKDGENSIIKDEEFLNVFGIKKKNLQAGELWKYLLNEIKEHFDVDHEVWVKNMEIILKFGTLSSRILKSLDSDYSHENILNTYRKISKSLASNKMFLP
jgi:carboxylate-amine ligase